MRRRDFITLLGSATAAWPVAVNAQQPERLLRIGVLMNRAADNPEGQDRLAAFQQGLQESGWGVGEWSAGRFAAHAPRPPGNCIRKGINSLHPSGSEGPIVNATVAEEQYDDGGSVP